MANARATVFVLAMVAGHVSAQDVSPPGAPSVQKPGKGLGCPVQVKPYLPRAARVAGIEGTVEATVLIQDGAVLEVLGMTGPPALRPTVVLALAKYQCDKTPVPVIATQSFQFRLTPDVDTEPPAQEPSSPAPAPTPSEVLAARLATQMNVHENILAARRAAAEEIDTEVEAFLSQMNGIKLPDDVRAALQKAVEDYKRKVSDAWSSKRAMALYVQDLAQGLDDEEIAGAIEYFSSPKGVHSKEAIQHADATLNQYMRAQFQRAAEREGRILAKRLLELQDRMGSVGPSNN